jgi:hypothetical protein
MTEERKPDVKRYPFTVTGYVDIDTNDFEAMELPAKIRRMLYAEGMPLWRRHGVKGVHIKGQRYQEDTGAEAFAIAEERRIKGLRDNLDGRETPQGRPGLQEEPRPSGSPAVAASQGEQFQGGER